MMSLLRSRLVHALAALAVSTAFVPHSSIVRADYEAMLLTCVTDSFRCGDVANSETVFGHYVGHDEPAMAFYSNQPGSGNHMTYHLTLPADPPSTSPQTRSYNFQLHPTFWFAMAMCDS